MAENKKQISKLEEAVRLSFDEWNKKQEEKLQEAEKNGELPTQSEEERRANARKIWEKAHAEE